MEKFPQKLLVEGLDDLHVVLALCQKFNVPENFDIISVEGLGNLEKQLNLRLKQSDTKTIGVIVDADTDIRSRWQQIVNLFRSLSVFLPEEIPATGLIYNNPGQIKIGVWVMPDNRLDGILEDFIAFLVPEEDRLLPVVKSNLDSVEHEGLHKYKAASRSKAVIHSWLACQEEPGTPLGLAITKKYLALESDSCHLFMNWLKNLYNLAPSEASIS